MNIVSGNDGANTLSGTNGDDLIYGFDPNAPYASATIAATRVASGLSQPLYVTAAPGDTSRLFIVEKGGTIKILDLNSGQVLATPFLTVPVDTASERGLLGLAFDPDYATNGAFYVYATSSAPSPHNEVWRYHVSGNPNVAAAGRDLILDVGPSTNGNHNAGWLAFGPDGDLYIASGEVGVAANAQDKTNLLGKILRIDVDPVAPGYQIPADNPFVGEGGGVRGEIWAYGLRNPWRDELRPRDRQFLHRQCRRRPRSRRSISGRRARTTAGRSPKASSDESELHQSDPLPIRTAAAHRSPAAMSIAARATD